MFTIFALLKPVTLIDMLQTSTELRVFIVLQREQHRLAEAIFPLDIETMDCITSILEDIHLE